MKSTIFFIAICISVAIACKSTQKTANSTNAEQSNQMTQVGNTIGKVSHKYRATGCATVVIIIIDGEKELVLIPKDKLSNDFDVNGLELKFNYRPLKMPQPPGCNVGIPAALMDISKK